MDKYKKLATNTIIFAISKFSSSVLSFLLMPYVTAKLVAADYSTADLIQQTANVLIPVVFLQINSAALRFSLDKQENKKDVLTVGIRTTVQGFLVFLLFYYPITLIKLNDTPLGDYAPVIYIFVFVSGMRQLCQQFVRGCGFVKLYAVDGIVATGTTLLFNLLFLGPFNWGVYGYVFAIIASDACSIILLFFGAKLWRYVTFSKVPKKIRHEMLKYSIPMVPSIILWWITNVSDRYMVTYFVGASQNGLYTAASKIPNYVILFSTVFIDAWQLSAVDEYDSESREAFFTKVFRVYSGGIFVVASALILFCRLITRILVSGDYYTSWQFVPVLIIATSFSCLVNFLASVYMAEKKSFMGMVTALSGAVTNIVLNLVLIPAIGAMGAAVATVISYLVVFVFRAINTHKYIKIGFKFPVLAGQSIILVLQCVLMMVIKNDILMYSLQALLTLVMVAFNFKPIKELVTLVLGKVLHKNIA